MIPPIHTAVLQTGYIAQLQLDSQCSLGSHQGYCAGPSAVTFGKLQN